MSRASRNADRAATVAATAQQQATTDLEGSLSQEGQDALAEVRHEQGDRASAEMSGALTDRVVKVLCPSYDCDATFDEEAPCAGHRRQALDVTAEVGEWLADHIRVLEETGAPSLDGTRGYLGALVDLMNRGQA